MAEEILHLSEREITYLSFKIAELLDSAPMSQALHVLEETKRLLLDGHLVNLRRLYISQTQGGGKGDD